jgi:hypothetical protein
MCANGHSSHCHCKVTPKRSCSVRAWSYDHKTSTPSNTTLNTVTWLSVTRDEAWIYWTVLRLVTTHSHVAWQWFSDSGRFPSSRFPNCPRTSGTNFSFLTNTTPNWLNQQHQSSKLLLVLASTVVFCFGPHRDPWPYICFFTLLRVLKWCPLFDKRRGLATTGHSPSTGEWINDQSPYVAPVPIAQKTCLPLLHVFLFQGNMLTELFPSNGCVLSFVYIAVTWQWLCMWHYKQT